MHLTSNSPLVFDNQLFKHLVKKQILKNRLQPNAGPWTLHRDPNILNVLHNTSLTSFSTTGKLHLTPIQ